MLTRHQDMVMDFDFAKVVEQTKDNPIFYVQYAHARCHSVLRHGREAFGEIDLLNTHISLLTDENELAMIKVLAMLPQQMKIAAALREPHRIANYVYEVAATFHALWNKGKDQVELRFIDQQNKELTAARLSLIQATINVIANCFHLFGVTPLEEMR
jgi:arginyl-tRNA synthetase